MMTLSRVTRNSIPLLCVMGLFVYTCGAETMATYSGQYTTDLEQKHVLLQSISEDIVKTESQAKEAIENVKDMKNTKMRRLNSDNIDLAEIMPHTEKINIAFIGMSGTLSPKSAGDGSVKGRDNSRD